MTCYFRHLGEIFKKAGIEVTKENKKSVDQIIHAIVGADYKNCPQAWKGVKKRISDDKAKFISELKAAWNRTETKK